MGFTEAIKTCFGKYFVFSGRASRSEFWWFYLACVALLLVLSLVGLGNLSGLVWLATMIPFLAVAWRRMHDIGRSGAMILLPFAIQIGAIYVFLFGQLGRMMPALEAIEVSPETTIGELQSKQLEALQTSGIENVTFADVVPALIVFLIGLLWMVYLLTRQSQPGPNTYGPNPNEVTP